MRQGLGRVRLLIQPLVFEYVVRTIEYCFINVDSSNHHQVYIKLKNNLTMVANFKFK